MLPTIERLPRRSMYNSPTMRSEVLVFCSKTATRVSPRSAETRTVFFIGFLLLLPPRLAQPRLHMNALQYTYGQQRRDYGGTPEAHQRQWDARDRHDSQVHANVDEDLKEQRGGNAAGHEGSVGVLGKRHDAQCPPDEEGVEG